MRFAPGMLAEIATLNADYMSVAVERMGMIGSVLTMIGGRAVHASP